MALSLQAESVLAVTSSNAATTCTAKQRNWISCPAANRGRKTVTN
jgi:hypothetical protein